MEYHLFYMYLKHRKEQKREQNAVPMWKQIPLWLWLLFGGGVIANVFGIVLPLRGWAVTVTTPISVIALACMAICNFAIEHIQIRDSAQRYEEHWKRAFETKRFLESNKLNDSDYIKAVKERVDGRTTCLKAKREKADDRYTQWVQALAVPTFLAAAGTVFDRQETFGALFAVMLVMLLSFAAVILLISFLRGLCNIFEFTEYARLCSFSEDLQAVLDIDTFHIDPPCEDSPDTPNT